MIASDKNTIFIKVTKKLLKSLKDEQFLVVNY